MYVDYSSLGAQTQPVVVIVAPPHDSLAPALAVELERLNVRVAPVLDIEPYAGRMSACIVVLWPQTAHSSAVRVIFDVRPPQLIPVLAVPMELPPGPWTTPPITLARGVESAAYEIAGALYGVRAPNTRPVYPQTPEYAPEFPAHPGYPTTPAYPSTPGTEYFTPHFVLAPAPAPPAKRRSHAVAWTIGSIMFALVVALAVVGGVLAERQLIPQLAYQSSPTATVPANFTTYTDTHGLYRLDVPDGWTSLTRNNIIGFGAPTRDAAFEVGSINNMMSADEMSVDEQEFFKALASESGGNGTYTNLQGPTSVMLAGATWTRETADLTLGGNPAHAVMLIANHSGSGFTLAYFAYTAVFASTDASDFQTMPGSFQFLI